MYVLLPSGVASEHFDYSATIPYQQRGNSLAAAAAPVTEKNQTHRKYECSICERCELLNGVMTKFFSAATCHNTLPLPCILCCTTAQEESGICISYVPNFFPHCVPFPQRWNRHVALCIICVFSCHQPLGLLLSNGGHGIFNMHNNLHECYAHEGRTGNDKSAQLLTWKNGGKKRACSPCLSWGQIHNS